MSVPTVPPPAGVVPASARRGWRFPWLQLVAALVVLVGTCVFLYPQTAAWFTQKEQSRVLALGLNNHAPGVNESLVERQAAELARAHAYNDALSSGAVLASNANVPTSQAQANSDLAYETLLPPSTGSSDLMARLKYEAVGIDLPVYHGTSDETLLRGVGHLEGTSLPVGGKGTRAVLTGHRGLASAAMFDPLADAAVGDTFTVTTQGQTLTYRVRDMKVIAPEDTEELRAEPGADLITLVTCTPLGINSHRILVTGERITPTPIEDILAAEQPSHLPGFPWWAVILGTVLVCAVGYVWWSGFPAKTRAKKGPGVGNAGSVGAGSTGTQE